MKAKPESRVWVWRFDHGPDRVWPILADTARWNEAAELPKHKTLYGLDEFLCHIQKDVIIFVLFYQS